MRKSIEFKRMHKQLVLVKGHCSRRQCPTTGLSSEISVAYFHFYLLVCFLERNTKHHVFLFSFTEPTATACKVITTKWAKIRTNHNCTSEKAYQHTQCSGYCRSQSVGSYGDAGVESTCTCCQPELSEMFENIALRCDNGQSMVTNFMVIKTCRCRQYKCMFEPDKTGMVELNSQGKKIEVNQQSPLRRRR